MSRNDEDLLAGETFADRMALAFSCLTTRPPDGPRRVDPRELGEMVGRRLDGAPVPPAVVITWFADAVPDVPTTLAIAQVCGVDPGWLAFGAASGAPSPFTPPPRERPANGARRAGVGVWAKSWPRPK